MAHTRTAPPAPASFPSAAALAAAQLGTYKPCSANADCLSNTCVASLCRQAATCTNGVKDGRETDVDCGGGGCDESGIEGRR